MLRAAGTVQLILSVLFVIGGVTVYLRGVRPLEGPVVYIIAFFGATLWFVASLFLRRQQRWAWWISVGIAAFVLLLMAYRLATHVATIEQVAFMGAAIIVDLVLLIRGREGAT